MKPLDLSSWPLPDRIFQGRYPDALRFVAINDPHLSAHNPASYKADYWQLCKETLRKVFKFAEQKEVDGILWSGDIFNLKSPTRNPLWFMSEVIDLMGEVTIPHLAIAGNHDIKFGHLAKGFRGQPVEILEKSRIIQLLDKQEAVFRIPHEGKDFSVRIAGASYFHGKAEPVMEKTKKGADRLVTLGHFWFGPQSGEFYGEPIYGPDILGTGEPDVYIIGHHHEDQGVQVIGNKTYASVGSLGRTGAHKNDLTRRPAALFLEISPTAINTSVLRPSMPPPEEVMDLEKREQVVKERQEMESFLAAMNTAQLTSNDPKAILDELAPTPVVKEKVLEYLEQAEEASA